MARMAKTIATETHRTTRGTAGVEGPHDIREVERLRARQIRNALALNLLSVGTPLLLMGDEARRMQLGNNNAYCQNNELSWFDWSLCQKHAGIHRFVQFLIQLRLRFSVQSTRRFPGRSLISLHRQRSSGMGCTYGRSISRLTPHSLAATAYIEKKARSTSCSTVWGTLILLVAASTFRRAVDRGVWLIDTFQDAPSDFLTQESDTQHSTSYTVQPRSIVLMTTGRCGCESP